MKAFHYIGVSMSGARVSGVEEAASREEAASTLQARRIHPLAIGEAKAATWSNWAKSLRPKRRHAAGLLVTTGQLATLVLAGLTVDRTLTIAMEQTETDTLRDALGRIRTAIRSGSGLAEAMSIETGIFPHDYVGLIRAGEMTGRLGESLSQLQSNLQRRDAMTSRIRSALIYPCILILAGIGSLLLLSDFVLPQFVPLFKEAGRTLPLATRLMLSGSQAVGAATPYCIAAGLALPFVLPRLLAKAAVKLPLHTALLALPVFGPLWRNLEAARLARTAGALLRAGVTLPVAIALSLQVLSNAAMQHGGVTAVALIREGASASEGLAKSKILPKLCLQLLSVGEETGRIDDMFFKQAELLEEAAERRISFLLALLVPGLTVAIGVLVGSVLAAVMLAVLQLNELAG